MRYQTVFIAATACLAIAWELTVSRPDTTAATTAEPPGFGPRFCELLVTREQRALTASEEQELWELRMQAKQQLREHYRMQQAQQWRWPAVEPSQGWRDRPRSASPRAHVDTREQ